jgi:membrane protease YdiL (CAAX protease family)
MRNIQETESRHPLVLAVSLTFALIVLYIVAGITAEVVSSGDISHQVVEAVARLAAAGVFALIIRGFGMMRDAGITRAGTGWVWLLVIVVIIYRILVHSYAFFGSLGLAFPWSPLSAAVALNGGAAGVLEEVAFRGAVLGLLLRCWGRLSGGATRSALLTAALFGGSHIIRLAVGQPLPTVGLLVLDAFLAGIFYAALVIRARSIWPAVLIHLVLNAYVGARAVSVPGFEETLSAWGVILLFELPLVALGLYWLRKHDTRRPGA